ncbi:MAG: hypothetical protein OXI55_15130 [Gammaproteobacteria bacterium]|nr:hypothetical protein [Gammaproteobacteria bacterium]
MRRFQSPWLGVAALLLTAAALPTWAQEAEDARQGDTAVPRVDVPREIATPEEGGAPDRTTQAAQQQWEAERAELVAAQRRTEDELAALRVLNADLEDDRQLRWMLIGGGLMLIGIVLGVLIKSRPQRRDAWQ